MVFSLMFVMNQSGGPPWANQQVWHRWTRLTGWPVLMVAGGPVELGGLQPYVFGVQHSMVDLHGWAMLLGHRWARLTGWPVAMVAGGPVELGGLQPYVYWLQHGGPPWVDHAAGAQVGQVNWVACGYGCRWTS